MRCMKAALRRDNRAQRKVRRRFVSTPLLLLEIFNHALEKIGIGQRHPNGQCNLIQLPNTSLGLHEKGQAWNERQRFLPTLAVHAEREVDLVLVANEVVLFDGHLKLLLRLRSEER